MRMMSAMPIKGLELPMSIGALHAHMRARGVLRMLMKKGIYMNRRMGMPIPMLILTFQWKNVR
jgi:hypothetical protein